jgi:mannose-6-phosphate isomerase
MKREKVKFPKIKSVGKRPWGEELLVALIPKKISLKILKIKKGMKGGIQYHHKKNECGYLISGTLIIRYDNGSGKLSQKTLKAGGSFHFPPGSIHQEEALTDCTIIEASTPHFNDRVRVDEKYGQSSDQGMRSTKKSEVLIK